MEKNVLHTIFVICTFFVISTFQTEDSSNVREGWVIKNISMQIFIQNTKNRTSFIKINGINLNESKLRSSENEKSDLYIFEDTSKSKEPSAQNTRKYKKITGRRYIPFAYHKTSKSSYKPSYRVINEDEEVCIPNTSEDFPTDLFTEEQKRHGAVFLHFICGIYCFTLLAVVCNDYFLPSVERICEVLKLSEDVAAATFMAIATSAPEFFVNIVGTFVTESDIGVGTVVGSAMFNSLGVAALGGLAASKPIQLHWWPLTRDSIIYVVVVGMLVLMCRDDEVQWYEAAILLIFYIVYFIIMWANGQIKKQAKRVVNKVKTIKSKRLQNEQSSTNTVNSLATNISVIETGEKQQDTITIIVPDREEKEKEEPEHNQLFRMPDGSWIAKSFFIYSWPIRLVLTCTIPDCKRYPKLFPITFIMCVVWIGSNSYMVSWMITVIGNIIGVPDFVMGLTFLAAGGCLPEAISIVIVSRKGSGAMGVSNSLGANTLDILLCLGLPWFIKTITTQNKPIILGSGSLFYTITALILAVATLYGTICLSGYKLNKKVGIILITAYACFLTAAILSEIFWMKEENAGPCLQ